MFGFIGKLFGSDKAASALIDNVSSGLDKLYYSDEEKADDAAKSRSEARSMILDWMKNTQGQNLARRLIALVVTSIWCLQYVAMMVLSVSAVWVESESERLIASANVIGGYAESMNGAMMLILGFYFAAPHLGAIAEGALKKFGGTK